MAVRRLAVALILALTGLTVVVGYRHGDDGPPHRLTAAAEPAPSGTDVHFAHMMVLHHEQAVRMSRSLLAKPDVPERVRLIADFIVHDQQREIDRTNAWLTAWGEEPVDPAAAGEPAPDAAHGMLTEAQLKSLDRAGPRTAADRYLRLMIEHHRGAVAMSQALLDAPAANAYLHGMAKHVVNEQSAEVDAMRALLRPGPTAGNRVAAGGGAGLPSTTTSNDRRR